MEDTIGARDDEREFSSRLRLDSRTRERLQSVVALGRYRSQNAAIIAAINRLCDELQTEQLEAGYAAAVAENPSYPYESADERQIMRHRRDQRHAACP